MEWLTELFGAGASVATGGVFGVVGSVLGQVSRFFQEKQRQAWEQKKWDHEKALIELNMQAKSHETEMELKITQSQGSWTGLATSINADMSSGESYKWVNAVKKLFRPFVTTLLWIIAYVVFRQTEGMEELSVTQEYMVETIYFTAATATLWWFGDRAFTPARWKNK